VAHSAARKILAVDAHLDYPFKITEGSRLKIGADLFNITNNRTLLRVTQTAQRTIGVPDADFLKPTGIGPSAVTGNTNPGYLRPFNARFSVRYEFYVVARGGFRGRVVLLLFTFESAVSCRLDFA
jgi:hypothetical protein